MTSTAFSVWHGALVARAFCGPRARVLVCVHECVLATMSPPSYPDPARPHPREQLGSSEVAVHSHGQACVSGARVPSRTSAFRGAA
ncbi:hypothetical protein OH77DRAFT_1190423 [Trametes cingulata]|nr:hypothetical protein OH77DRAFT_1190423 [Trametes cingulata]